MFCYCIFSALLFASLPSSIFAQDGGSREDGSERQDPAQLVREVVQNEIQTQLHDDSLWCFREQKEQDSQATKTLQVCGTQDGDLERLVAVNGREISPAEMQAEDQRIKKLVAHPAQLRANQKKQHEDAEQLRSLMKALPEAFHFQYSAVEGHLIKLSFRPNHAFRPSTRATLVFHHVEGSMVIDQEQKRIAEISGRITSEVKFVGGLLGHLDKGGTFLVKAGQVASGHWDVLLMNLDISGRALFFKTISVHEKEMYGDYTRVPAGAALEQVAQLLSKECNNLRTASTR
jgi:hypothetical protein